MDDTQKRIEEIEAAMLAPDFWNDKQTAQQLIKELGELKDKAAGKNKYDKGNAIITIFAGAGGLDSEDFCRLLFGMYGAYIEKHGWTLHILHQNENDHSGYRNITFEVGGKDAYGTLKHEAGVHRLVRISPFNAKKQRHTSFAMVDVVPQLDHGGDIEIADSDLSIDFAKSSGPGGQNVNKRETAVRIVHIPTNIAVHVDSERTQAQNREKAMDILKGKLYLFEEKRREKEAAGLSVSKTTEAEWGSQIRSYVLHPYKMVKDHRTDVETANIDAVLEDGDLDAFIEAHRTLEAGDNPEPNTQ